MLVLSVVVSSMLFKGNAIGDYTVNSSSSHFVCANLKEKTG